MIGFFIAVVISGVIAVVIANIINYCDLFFPTAHGGNQIDNTT